ncbi:1431_t:CDS:2, partial [Funneliformis geosporum]
KIIPETKTQTSGVLLFSLQLGSVRQHHKRPLRTCILKPMDQVTNSTLTKKLKILANHTYKIEFGDENKVIKRQRCEAIVKTIDQIQILRNAYINLAAIKNELP